MHDLEGGYVWMGLQFDAEPGVFDLIRAFIPHRLGASQPPACVDGDLDAAIFWLACNLMIFTARSTVVFGGLRNGCA